MSERIVQKEPPNSQITILHFTIQENVRVMPENRTALFARFFARMRSIPERWEILERNSRGKRFVIFSIGGDKSVFGSQIRFVHQVRVDGDRHTACGDRVSADGQRSEEHTSELQSQFHL